MKYCYMESPIGQLLLAGDDQGLRLVQFPNEDQAKMIQDDWQEDEAFFQNVKDQLNAYFVGNLKHFDLKLHLEGTPFQVKVWEELQNIPYATTISYGELAQRIGNPKSMRAVGAANGRNHIPIIIPCHRVIGKSGKLVGFGGGLDTKQFLLELEQQDRQQTFDLEE